MTTASYESVSKMASLPSQIWTKYLRLSSPVVFALAISIYHEAYYINLFLLRPTYWTCKLNYFLGVFAYLVASGHMFFLCQILNLYSHIFG